MIWAQSADGVIGADGGLPWSLPKNLDHVRAATIGARSPWDGALAVPAVPALDATWTAQEVVGLTRSRTVIRYWIDRRTGY